MAAIPQAIAIQTGEAGDVVHRGKNITGSVPFATSKAKTTNPIFAPRTRMTFVAPRFPEPCFRRSTPRALPARYADGMDPAAYESATARAGCISRATLLC